MQPLDPIRDTAIRLLRVHTLRAADALQLTAEGRPASLEIVRLDERQWETDSSSGIIEIARREGYRVAA